MFNRLSANTLLKSVIAVMAVIVVFMLSANVWASWGRLATVGRILNERGFRKLSARPKHPEVDGAAQEAFRQTSQGSYAIAFLGMPGPCPSRSGSKTRPASDKRGR